jgi:hypothetical protein
MVFQCLFIGTMTVLSSQGSESSRMKASRKYHLLTEKPWRMSL